MTPRLLVIVCVMLSVARAQETRSTPPADRITVNVHHDPDDPKDPKCPLFVAGETCPIRAHWHISMSGRRYELTDDGLAKFAEALTKLGKTKLEDPARGISACTMIIRADRTAPYGYVQQVLKQAGVGRIYKTEVGVGVPKETRIEKPASQPERAESRPLLPALPARIANELHEIKVTLRRGERDGVIERRIGDTATIPEGPQGDAAFAKAVRREVWRAWPSEVTIIIDVDPGLPWKAVVAILDAGKAGGAGHLEFGLGDAPESRSVESRAASRK